MTVRIKTQRFAIALMVTPCSLFCFEYFRRHSYRAYFFSAGWNRATQDLIDNGRYITGQFCQVTGSPALWAPAQ